MIFGIKETSIKNIANFLNLIFFIKNIINAIEKIDSNIPFSVEYIHINIANIINTKIKKLFLHISMLLSFPQKC